MKGHSCYSMCGAGVALGERTANTVRTDTRQDGQTLDGSQRPKRVLEESHQRKPEKILRDFRITHGCKRTILHDTFQFQYSLFHEVLWKRFHLLHCLNNEFPSRPSETLTCTSNGGIIGSTRSCRRSRVSY